MSTINALFFDVGGVILTNGWDLAARQQAAAKFGLEMDSFERRHQAAVNGFEAGQTSLPEYLAQVVFNQRRSFGEKDFRDFMFAQSQEISAVRSFVDRLARAGRWRVAAINNEGREVNAYRIATFDLRRTFADFFSSCYLGVRKPSPAIFRMALDVTQRRGAESIFVDDRLENVEGARQAGLTAIRFQDLAQLERELQERGVALPAASGSSGSGSPARAGA
jgi:putative hydrolase of the HAD superfamily